jgi:hypothetical protein
MLYRTPRVVRARFGAVGYGARSPVARDEHDKAD